MSDLNREMLDHALNLLRQMPERRVYVVNMSDILMILRILKKEGFTWKRGHSIQGKRNNTVTLFADGNEITTLYVNQWNTGNPGEIISVPLKVFKPFGLRREQF